MSSNREEIILRTLSHAQVMHAAKEQSSFAETEKDYMDTVTKVLEDAIADPQLRPEDAIRLEITVLNFQRDTLLMTESSVPFNKFVN